MNRRRITTIAGALVAGVTVLAGCSGGGGSASGDGTFTYGLVDDPGNLNPFLTTSNSAREVTGFLYDNLVFFDAKTGEPKPWLATKWEQTPTSVTYTLRKDVTCSDGSKLTPEVVANNFNWVTNPKNESAINGVLVPADAKATFDDAAGTVTLKVKAASSFLLTQSGGMEIMCQAALDDPKKAAKASVGTGLYTVDKAVTGDTYTLKRRDGYTWGPEGGNTSKTAAAPSTVTIKVVENLSTAANLLMSGDLNAATITGPDEKRVADKTDVGRRTSMIAGQLYFSELKGKPTADPDVRLALAHAMDLDALTKVVTNGKGYRAKRLAMMNPNPCQYDATKDMFPKRDVAEAERLLDEAGWKKGSDGMRSKDGKPLKLSGLYTVSDTMSATFELLKKQLKEVGVTLDLDGGDNEFKLAKLYEKSNIGSYDIADAPINAWLPSIMVPWNTGALPPGGRNSGGIDNKDYNRLIGEAGTKTGAASCDTWKSAEQELYKAVDTIPYAAEDTIVYLKGAKLALGNTISGPSVQLTD